MRNIKPGFKRGLWFGMFNAAMGNDHAAACRRGRCSNKPRLVALDKLDEYESPDRD